MSSIRVGCDGGCSGKDAVLISMLRCAKAKCVSRARQTCELRFMSCLFGWDGRQRAGWWWARARREVLRCHVGLVVDDGGHCVELKVKLLGLYGAEALSRLL